MSIKKSFHKVVETNMEKNNKASYEISDLKSPQLSSKILYKVILNTNKDNTTTNHRSGQLFNPNKQLPPAAPVQANSAW